MRTMWQKTVLTIAAMLVVGAAWSAGREEAVRRPAQVVRQSERLSGYRVENRRFTGIPSMAVAPGGRLWAAWYAGMTPDEDSNNYVVLTTSNDRGATWNEVLVIDPDGAGPVRAFDPELWVDPTGVLWFFWAQTTGYDGNISGVWAIRTSEPDRQDAAWSAPRRLTDGVMMCKPTVLSSGEWVLPASTWRETDNSARVVVSRDGGETWQVRGAVHVPKEVRSFDEPMIVERRDGSLWMLVRTEYGIGESVSKDKGKTWSELQPSVLKHPSARFFIRRLASGNLLLVKHGSIDMAAGRSHLMAFLSADDGASWSPGLLLDAREQVSYPDGQQDADGVIHIIYDRSRYTDQEILMVTFTEEDILATDHDRRLMRVDAARKRVSAGGVKPKK